MTLAARNVPGRPRDASIETWAWLLLCARGGSVRDLARKLGVSGITVKRTIRSLRAGGRPIVSVRRGARWTYEVRPSLSPAEREADSLVRAAGCVKAWRTRPEAKTEDADYDED
jgi:biotin operon repressor